MTAYKRELTREQVEAVCEVLKLTDDARVWVLVVDPQEKYAVLDMLRFDDAVILTGEVMELSSYSKSANGTVQATIKKKKR